MQEIWTNAFFQATGSFEFMTVVYALLAAVAVLVVMKKAGLMRRAARWQRALVCVYYLYIPVVFVAGGVAWAAVGSLEHTMLATIDQARPAISRASAEYAGSAWKVVVAKFRKEPTISLREMCLTVTRDYASQLLEGFSSTSRFTAFMKPVADAVQEGVALSLAKIVEEDIVKKAADVTRLDMATLRGLWTADLVEAFQGGIVCDLMAGQTKRAFRPLYQYIRLVFILLLLPVALETGWSVYRRRKKPELPE